MPNKYEGAHTHIRQRDITEKFHFADIFGSEEERRQLVQFMADYEAFISTRIPDFPLYDVFIESIQNLENVKDPFIVLLLFAFSLLLVSDAESDSQVKSFVLGMSAFLFSGDFLLWSDQLARSWTTHKKDREDFVNRIKEHRERMKEIIITDAQALGINVNCSQFRLLLRATYAYLEQKQRLYTNQ